MVKRHVSKGNIRKDQILDVFECPDCKFRFDAQHIEGDAEGGWICPQCEIEEIDIAYLRIDRILDLLEIAEDGVDITRSLRQKLLEALEDNGPVDFVYDPARMTEEQEEYANGAVV